MYTNRMFGTAKCVLFIEVSSFQGERFHCIFSQLSAKMVAALYRSRVTNPLGNKHNYIIDGMNKIVSPSSFLMITSAVPKGER